MVRLEPMSESGFRAFLERAIPRRAARYVARGVWAEPESVAASREVYDRLLPEGRETPGNFFAHVVPDDGTAQLGEVWYSSKRQGGKLQFWLQWIWIEPEFRRRGFAAQAIRLLESIAREQGATELWLDVWSDNPGAIELYSKIGFTTAARHMVRTVGRARPEPEGSVRRAVLGREP